jgi:hypothetical protein
MKSTEELIDDLRDIALDQKHPGEKQILRDAADRLEELSKERAEMVETLRNRRVGDREDGLTLRDSAACFCVSPVTLSKWTATEPTTEPDFVD